MIKKRENPKFEVYEHLGHYLSKTTYKQRLQWLEEANEFVAKLRRKKGYPRLEKSQNIFYRYDV